MNILIVVNDAPYGSDRTFNALRLADALLAKGEWVDLFLMGDGVYAARTGQDPRGTRASLETMLADALAKGAAVTLCGTCCQARGLADGDLVGGARVGTIHDLSELVRRADRLLTF